MPTDKTAQIERVKPSSLPSLMTWAFIASARSLVGATEVERYRTNGALAVAQGLQNGRIGRGAASLRR